jgi:N-acetyl-anhydromuramyl-L-alanine amidase AmpD
MVELLKKKIIPLLLAVAISVTAFLMPVGSVQALTVSQQYINQNRSYQSLQPQGLVIHDTDNAGATAQNNRDYFNRVYAAASAHYFVDWNKAIQTIPETEVAWHAGYTANHRYLSLEMCEPSGHNIAQFNAMYQKTVELAADICRRHGWNASNIVSHYWCSMTFRETDHEDPIAFLKEYGKSWDILLSDIQKAINGQSVSTTVTAPSTVTSNPSVATLQAELNLQAFGNLAVDNIPGPKTLAACPVMRHGAHGNITKWIQQKLGVNPDSDWGPITDAAVRAYQKTHGLTPDGIIGYYTWKSFLGL